MDEGRNRRGFSPVPVEEGKEYDMTIEGIGSKGDGIGRIKGFVVIVPNTQEGQTVKVRVNAVRGKVAFADVVGEAEAKPEEEAEAEEADEGEDLDAEELAVADEANDSDEEAETGEDETEEVSEDAEEDAGTEDEEASEKETKKKEE